MAKRVSEPLRNLDDSLRVLHLLTFRSCGIVLAFFSICHALEWQMRSWSRLFGSLSFAMELLLTGALALLLAWVERHDDEYFVPAALRYYAAAALQRAAGREIARAALGSAAICVACDFLETAFPFVRVAMGQAAAFAPVLLAALWAATRPLPRLRRTVVFSGAALSSVGPSVFDEERAQ
jgi:hypothetical protein